MDLFFITALSLYILTFITLIYTFLIADPTTSPIAKLITHQIPNFILTTLEQRVGPNAKSCLLRTHHYLAYEPNPALLIVYLVVVLGSWSIMFAHGYPYIPSHYLASHHRYTGYIVFILCMGSWRMACRTPPGTITLRTLPKYDHYPYDNLLFTPRTCPTLKIRKLPRSKFDRVTQTHIPKFDHYCGWLNQPVGEENYRMFLLFVLIQTCMCLYGAIVTVLILWGEVVEKKLMEATFYNVATGMEVKASPMVVFHFITKRHFYLSGLLLLMSVMGFILTIFLFFHIYLIINNMTTNEFFKWKQIKKWHKNATKRYKQALESGNVEKSSNASVSVALSDDGYVVEKRVVVTTTTTTNSNSRPKADALDDMDVGCTGVKAVKEVRNGMDDDNQVEKVVSREERIRTMEEDDVFAEDPGPMPKNIYDLGIVENVKEVIFPRSLRPDALARWQLELTEEREKRIKEEKKVPSGKVKES